MHRLRYLRQGKGVHRHSLQRVQGGLRRAKGRNWSAGVAEYTSQPAGAAAMGRCRWRQLAAAAAAGGSSCQQQQRKPATAAGTDDRACGLSPRRKWQVHGRHLWASRTPTRNRACRGATEGSLPSARVSQCAAAGGGQWQGPHREGQQVINGQG